MPKPPVNLDTIESLMKVVEDLRGPDGCPWDKEQTHETLTRFAIEEAHELADAIDRGDRREIIDELGDLLLQVVLHSEIARQAGTFTLKDVISAISEKMVRRHPHVFSSVKVSSTDEVMKNWQEIKKQEKENKPSREGARPLTFDIPRGMPALLRSQKIGEKTRKLNFDWQNVEDVFTKVEEEIGELKSAMRQRGPIMSEVESELGDALFSLAQLARHFKLDSEQSLRKTNERFERRFSKMLELAAVDGREWSTLSPDEREKFWQSAKAIVD